MLAPKEESEKKPKGPGEVTIGVMSQNLWSTYFSLVGRDRFGRLRSFAEALSKCEKQVDIVMLQEVYVAKLLGGAIVLGEDGMEMLKIGLDQKCGLKYFVRSQPGVSLNGTTDKARDSTAWAPNPVVHQNGGLIVASRYPIVSSRFLPFTRASLHESVNWKGMLEAQINVSGTLIKVINVHLDAGPYGPRSHQYHQIRHLLAEDKDDRPHLIAGDFNTCARSRGSRGASEYNEMRSCLPDYETVFDTDLPTHREPRGGVGLTLDYIFVDPTRVKTGDHRLVDFRCVTNSAAPVSDHFGLYSQLTVTTRTPEPATLQPL